MDRISRALFLSLLLLCVMSETQKRQTGDDTETDTQLPTEEKPLELQGETSELRTSAAVGMLGTQKPDLQISAALYCPVGKFRCSSGLCISDEFRCDDRDDCRDESDEEGCLGFRVSNCPESQEITQLTKRWVDWQGNGSYTYCQWWFKISPGLGLVLNPTQVNLRLGNHPENDDVLRVHTVNITRRYVGDGLIEPVIIRSDFVLFELVSYDGDTSNGSRFNLSYSTYNKSTLPTELEPGVYNCLPPHIVPEEFKCDGFPGMRCPGHYRCYQSNICVHPDYLCDRVYHCPLKEHERFSGFPCPKSCTCEGRAFKCKTMFDPADYLDVRYLDVSGSPGLSLRNLHYMGYLRLLNLSSCSLDSKSFEQGFSQNTSMVHLRVLDLHGNDLTNLTFAEDEFPALEFLNVSSSGVGAVSVQRLYRLRQLDLSNNTLYSFSLGQENVTKLEVLKLSSCGLNDILLVGLAYLRELDISDNNLRALALNKGNVTALEVLNLSSCGLVNVSVTDLVNLKVLDLSHNNLTSLSHVNLKGLPNVTSLDLSNNPLQMNLYTDLQDFLQASEISWKLRNLSIVNTAKSAGKGNHSHLSTATGHVSEPDHDVDVPPNPLSKLEVLSVSDIAACCAYHSINPNPTTRCETESERVFSRQCPTGEATDCDVGWLSYNKSCFRFVFPINQVSAASAANECREKFSAGLAAFPTPEAEAFAVSFLNLSKYTGLVVGLEKADMRIDGLRHLYRFLWRWTQAGTAFDGPHLQTRKLSLKCATLHRKDIKKRLQSVTCDAEGEWAYVCSKMRRGKPQTTGPSTWPGPPPSTAVPFRTTTCADDTLVHPFHPCRTYDDTTGSMHLSCKNGRRVHYTLTCDGFDDCEDGSDEEKCDEPAQNSSFLCTRRRELVDLTYVCNGIPDCHDGSDEDNCYTCGQGTEPCYTLGCLPPETCYKLKTPEASNTNPTEPEMPVSAVRPLTTAGMLRVDIDKYGFFGLTNVSLCPETHFACTEGYCIPSFLINNGIPDCPLGSNEDEAFVNVKCSGYYRCYRHHICLHPVYLCDQVYHCPLKDDERYCNASCPLNCECEGLAYSCKKMFDPADHLHTRYLDLSQVVQPDLQNLHYIAYLQFLNLSSCGLDKVSLADLGHLRVLDLSLNLLTSLANLSLSEMSSLTHLNVSDNFLMRQLDSVFSTFLSDAEIRNLQSLQLSRTGVERIEENVFDENLRFLTHLSIRGNKIRSIKRGMFRGLTDLELLETDDPMLCCAYRDLHPDNTIDCRTPMDELSSCNDLLQSSFLRVSLWILAFLAVIGNIGVLVYRVVFENLESSSGFRVLVTNLCVSDFLMGIYMMIIGSADALYSGRYIWKQEAWTTSGHCKVAGFLALLSSEVSALIISLITLDRMLVLCFPMRRNLHLTPRSSMIVCGAVWVLGLMLASAPLVPAEWTFYGQTGICLPLPITRKPSPGQRYAFGVFVIFNFFVFLLIGTGQVVIFRAIRKTPIFDKTHRRKQDMSVARRLFLIVCTDFCCWFPITLAALLASQGTPIPGEVNIWAAIFVLPINSAINPFLYTLGLQLERWLERREEKRIERMLAKLHIEMITWSETKIQELFTQCKRALGRQRSSRRAAEARRRRATVIDKPAQHDSSASIHESRIQPSEFGSDHTAPITTDRNQAKHILLSYLRCGVLDLATLEYILENAHLLGIYEDIIFIDSE